VRAPAAQVPTGHEIRVDDHMCRVSHGSFAEWAAMGNS
jgi:hypothetical protein